MICFEIQEDEGTYTTRAWFQERSCVPYSHDGIETGDRDKAFREVTQWATKYVGVNSDLATRREAFNELERILWYWSEGENGNPTVKATKGLPLTKAMSDALKFDIDTRTEVPR